jgi:hypothetical protein
LTEKSQIPNRNWSQREKTRVSSKAGMELANLKKIATLFTANGNQKRCGGQCQANKTEIED